MKAKHVMTLALLLPLLAACGAQNDPTTWQDVAFVAVLMLGWVGVTWAGRE